MKLNLVKNLYCIQEIFCPSGSDFIMVVIRRTIANIYIFTLPEITTQLPCSFLLLLCNMQFEINYIIILFYVEIISFTAHMEKSFYHNYMCSWYSD